MDERLLAALRGLEALATGQTALAAVVERGLAQIEAQDRELLAEVRGNREAVLGEQRALTHAIQIQTAAIEARTGLLRELGQGILKWLNERWVTLILGVAAGLGVAGAGEIARAVVGSAP